MDISETFKDELRIEFQDRLRIKWSGKSQAFLIQQRVGKNLIGSVPRAKLGLEKSMDLAEGYRTILSVAPSEHMKCPDCFTSISVPKLETKELKCLYCKLRGRSTKIVAGYYPLNSSLINHLKEIDPIRNLDRDLIAEMNDRNEKIQEAQVKQLSKDAEDYSSDNINKLMGILQTGYSGMKVKEGSEVKGITSN
jgi:hypothetical protein